MPEHKRAHLAPRTYLRLAGRNLLRNRRETLLAMATLALGVSTVTFLGAMNDGWLTRMQENFILTFTGHLQIHATGFYRSKTLQGHTFPGEALTPTLQQTPGIQAWTPRIRVPALASVSGANSNLKLMGVDPRREPQVTRIHRAISHGQWLSPSAPDGLVLGRAVAANLGARLGDRVILRVQGRSGDILTDVFHLRGIFATGAPQLDRTLGLVNLSTLQHWLGLDKEITGVVLRLSPEVQTQSVQRHLEKTLPQGRYEILSWRRIDPIVDHWLAFADAYGLVVLTIVGLLSMLQVANTMVTSVFNRIRELGLLESIGLRRMQLFALITTEALLLTAAGGGAGYLIGAALSTWYGRRGIDLSSFSDAFEFFYMSPIIHPTLTAIMGLKILLALTLAALLGSLYPAWKAVRLNPIQALRHEA